MHVGSSSTDPFSSRDAPPGVGSMVSFNNSMASLGDYLFGGIMHRFPKLKIAYSEGQIGWLDRTAGDGDDAAHVLVSRLVVRRRPDDATW